MIARCWISDSFSQKIEAFERGEIQSEPLEKLRVAAHAQGMRIAEYVLSMANYGIVLDSAKPAQEVVCNAQPIAEDDTEDVEFLQAPPDGATWWEWLQYDQEVERTRQHPTSQATLSLKVINNAGEIRDAWIPARDPPSSRLSLQYGVLEEARRTYLHGSRLDDMGV
ncbi:MAG TPA: hypothetical protein VM532_15910, partial [Burkholderiales bacterium]|nr:hypothetical protein [Burkholderiales bacterium]